MTEATLQAVDMHWAVLAVGEDKRDRALVVATASLVEFAMGGQLKSDLHDRSDDIELLHRLALAYEVAAIEGLDSVLRPPSEYRSEILRQQCHAGAWRAFELQRLLPIPNPTDDRLFHILHLAALGYCGDRWIDLRRWFKENHSTFTSPSVAGQPWDNRLLYHLYDCWVRLFRKNSWDDLDRIREIVAGLREDQRTYEADLLNNGNNGQDRHMALRLVALYHWAKATERLAINMLQGVPAPVPEQLDKHCESAQKAAASNNDTRLELLQRWLHVTAHIMMEGSYCS